MLHSGKLTFRHGKKKTHRLGWYLPRKSRDFPWLLMLELREGTSLHFIGPPPENPLSLAGFQAGLLSLMPCITPSFAAGIERKHHQNATRRIGRKRMVKVSRETTTFIPTTLPKTNMDTQNDGLEKVSPFKHGNFW